MRVSAIAAPFFAFLALATGAAAQRAWSAADLWNWREASDPRITPDGSTIVYIENWNGREANERFSNLWTVSTDGRPPRRLTEGPWRDRRPRWSPSGDRLAWISIRDGRAQIRVSAGTAEVSILTGDAQPSELAWSPDGRRIAFTARVGRGPGRIFVISAEGGAARPVSPGTLDCQGEPAWMPDGRTILTATAGGDIVAVRASDGSATPLATGGRNESPRPSPDGTKIAWLSTRAEAGYAVRKLRVMGADGSRDRVLTGTLDRDVAAPQWSSDSRTVYFLADDRGATHVYAARNDGTVRQASKGDERLRGFSLADNGRAVTVRSSADEGGAVVALDVHGIKPGRVLARPGQDLVAGRRNGSVEAFSYESAGNTIQAWLTRPPDFDPAYKYPLLLDLRDDPHRMCGPWLTPRAQVFAARGWVVMCVNPRGTPGYGEVFGGLLGVGWREDVLDDLMRGVDAAVALGYIDPRRLAVAGGSMAAWIVGHTGRFRAAVVRRPGETGGEPGEWPDLSGSGTPILVLDRLPARPRPGDRVSELERIQDWLEK